MSMYNTGSRSRGFGNGYVGRVYASSSVVVPAIRRQAIPEPAALPAPVKPEPKFTPPPAGGSSPRVQVAWDTTAGAQTASLIVFGAAPHSSPKGQAERSEEHTSELQSLMRI